MYITLCLSNNHNYDICTQSAGVAIPVSGIKTLESSGIGEFLDLKKARLYYIMLYNMLYIFIYILVIYLKCPASPRLYFQYACMYMHACMHDSSIGRPQTDVCVVINFAFIILLFDAFTISCL